MSDESPDDLGGPLVDFAPTSGRVFGVLGVVLAGGVLVLGAVRPGEVIAPVMIGAALGGALFWAALLRPRVAVDARTLFLRNMLSTLEIPLAAVDELVVRQVLAVRVGEKRYVSPAVGRKLRKMVKGPKAAPLIGPNLPDSMPDAVGPTAPAAKTATDVDYADHVESTLRGRVEDAQRRAGVRRYSDESLALAAGVRRLPAWPEIVALGVLAVAFIVSLLA